MQERLSVATGDYAHTRPLAGMTVGAAGRAIALDWRPDVPGRIFRAALADDAPFDAAEMSLATAWTFAEHEERRFVPIAVFPSRMYRLSGFYVRRGTAGPEALRGARIGVVRYGQTAAVWARAYLRDVHGIEPAECAWWVGERQPFAPRGIELHDAGGAEGLEAMLAAGEIDCLFSAQVPPAFVDGRIVRLFPDWPERERALFEASGAVPPMHTVVVRRALLDDVPGLDAAIVDAFDAARDSAIEWLVDTDASSIPVPLQHGWLAAYPDPASLWRSGVEANRAALDAFAGHMHTQGLTARRYAPEEVFASR